VVLSEDEARQVILEAALEYGVDFSGGKTLENVMIPRTNPFDFEGTWTPTSKEGSWTLDGYDANLKIGFEYVSISDVQNLRIPDDELNYWVSVESYDAKGTAERFAQNISDVVFFYSPMTYDQDELNSVFEDGLGWDLGQEEYEKRMREYTEAVNRKSRELLRAQVVDFLEWLVAQGVI